MNPSRLLLLGVVIIFVGFLTVALGAFTQPSGSNSSGGFILIGPFPIVFGSGSNSGMLAAVGLVITAIVVAFYIVSLFVWRSGRRQESRSEVGRVDDNHPNATMP
jgi:uncharacterized membrane protein